MCVNFRRGARNRGMADPSDSMTSPTLLGRLRDAPTDQAAWGQFVERYGRKIYAWCRQWQLQEADAEDVTQNVLVDLARQMRSFTYQPSGSFRSWLRTVAYRAWCDFLEGRKPAATGTGDSAVLQRLHSVEAREDLLKQLAEEADRELLDEAMKRVQPRVEPHTWEAFRLTTLERLPGAEAAERLGMQVTAVFKAKNRVQKMLEKEVEKLEAC
jgi:RNA polymerase sigma factor (sigma-70 family)